MKLLLFIVLIFLVALVRRAQPEDINKINGGFDEFEVADSQISVEPLEGSAEDNDDDDDKNNGENYEDEDEDEYEDEDEDEDETRPTSGYWPTNRRWPGYECMLKAKTCFVNATECGEYLACYEEKTTCIQAEKKKQNPSMTRPPPKMICKTMFNECMERAGNDCFKKYMCYRKKGFCYRKRKHGHRKPSRHHGKHRHHHCPHHHHRFLTMNPEMFKCKMQWIGCFRKASNCSERLQCMYDFHDCMNRSHPTGPPPTMHPDEDEENMNENSRWNPKLVAKCKKEFKGCTENASSCPLKLRCFWRMKMCFKSHHRRPYGYKNKMTVMSITRIKNPYYQNFGGQRNKEMGSRFGQTGRQWGNRGMGSFGQNGRQWGNRGMGSFGQTGRQWGNRGMGSFGQTGRQWGNRGMGSRFGQTGSPWGKLRKLIRPYH
ncbi:uncharacterized protein LOC116307093 [Actinia tenebrosa]|uniref:Uncharacterized protein LOC116307093 n=1 Tax=Actinia tenebrosa TaxID=6105 RepID=A0A6P8J0U7_ACTTE|nr:uncharacterized protein LOC116307093 [Actinia tenebrosa]